MPVHYLYVVSIMKQQQIIVVMVVLVVDLVIVVVVVVAAVALVVVLVVVVVMVAVVIWVVMYSLMPIPHCAKKPVTTMLTYPWKCTVLHCNHLGNTWKPLVLMTRHFDYHPR